MKDALEFLRAFTRELSSISGAHTQPFIARERLASLNYLKNYEAAVLDSLAFGTVYDVKDTQSAAARQIKRSVAQARADARTTACSVTDYALATRNFVASDRLGVSLPESRQVEAFLGEFEPLQALAPAAAAQRDSSRESRALQTWKLSKVLSGHSGCVRAVKMDEQNEYFFSASDDSTIKIWDFVSGRLQLTLTGHSESVRCLETFPDNTKLFSGGLDRDVLVWDFEQNAVASRLHSHVGTVCDLAYSAPLNVLFSASRDKTVKMWDLRLPNPVVTFKGHRDSVSALLVQNYSSQLISCGADRDIRLWDLRALHCTEVLTRHALPVKAAAAHPTLLQYFTADAQNVKVWVNEWSFSRDLQPCGHLLNRVLLKELNDQWFLWGLCDDGFLVCWDTATAQVLHEIAPRPAAGAADLNSIVSGTLDASETRLITGHLDNNVAIWRESTQLQRD